MHNFRWSEKESESISPEGSAIDKDARENQIQCDILSTQSFQGHLLKVEIVTTHRNQSSCLTQPNSCFNFATVFKDA